MNRFWKTGLLLAGAAFLAVSGFVIWHYLQAEPVVSKTSSVELRVQPATYRLVNSLEQKALQDEPESALYTQLGYAYVQSARESGDGAYNDQAEKAFLKALELDPADAQAMSGMGTVLLTRHQFEEALQWGRRSLEANPHKAATYGILVDANIELGRYGDAIQAAQDMVDMRPDLASYSRVSYVRELHGDLEGAIEAMKDAISAGSGNPENAIWCRVYLGHLYFHQGNLDAAEGAYREALYYMPGYGPALAGLGRIYLFRGRMEEAVAAYKEAVDAFPIPENVIALGEAYLAAGQKSEAEARFNAVIAELEGEMAGGMDVDEELALVLLEHRNSHQKALELAQGAYERRPTVKNASILAWAKYKNDRPAEALPLAQESLKLDTKEAVFYYRAGVIAAAAGQKDLARQHLRKALELNPYFSISGAAHAQEELALL